jgi:hypothetical protein
MTLTELRKILSDWAIIITDINDVIDELNKVVGSSPESALCTAVYAIAISYTKEIEAKIGDEGEFLQWFWFECQMGKRPMEAKAVHWDEMRPIETTDDLAELLYKNDEEK